MPQEGDPGGTFRVEAADQPDVLRLIGELDMGGTDALGRALQRHLERSSSLTLDLRELTFVDSTGIRALVTVARSLDGRGARLRLVSPRPIVDRLFRLVDLKDVPGIEID
jgi:anti-sigma B factor antagonist